MAIIYLVVFVSFVRLLFNLKSTCNDDMFIERKFFLSKKKENKIWFSGITGLSSIEYGPIRWVIYMLHAVGTMTSVRNKYSFKKLMYTMEHFSSRR